MTFKNNAPFISCISKINNMLIDNAEVMPMCNLTKYSKNYSKSIVSLWNYYRHEPNSGAVGDINYSIRGSKSFNYKTSIKGRLEGSNIEKEVEFSVPLKFLSNFGKTLDIVLVNCEVSLTLNWSKNCVITSKATRAVDPNADPAVAEIDNTTTTTFQITDSKMYTPVLTLSSEDDNKLLEQLKTGFKRTI